MKEYDKKNDISNKNNKLQSYNYHLKIGFVWFKRNTNNNNFLIDFT